MKKRIIKKYFSILIFIILLTTGCESESSLSKQIDNEDSTWYDEFLFAVDNKRIGNSKQITVQTDEPNTAGFRLVLLTYDQLDGVKWPKSYVIPFSTDEKGKAEIQLDYLFPELELKTIKVIDFKVYHPIIYTQGNKDYMRISDKHYEFKQTNWIDSYNDYKWDFSKLTTSYSFYEYAGRMLNLGEKLIPYDLSVLTGKDAYLVYIAADEELGKYSSLVLNMPEDNIQFITKAEAIAYLVRLYGFDSVDVDPVEEKSSNKCLTNDKYEKEWQIAIELGFIKKNQCPDDAFFRGDEALILINDWIEHFDLLQTPKEGTIKLFTKEEIKEFYSYGLSDSEINLMGYQATKTLLELFSTEIVSEEERKVVIDSFLEQKCAPIRDKNTYFCPDGNKAILLPDF